MGDEVQLTPLQLGQILTNLNASVRELTTQLIELRTKVELLARSIETDRQQIREFARDVKRALGESASSQSQELRVARIDTPLPPVPRHGSTRP